MPVKLQFTMEVTFFGKVEFKGKYQSAKLRNLFRGASNQETNASLLHDLRALGEEDDGAYPLARQDHCAKVEVQQIGFP